MSNVAHIRAILLVMATPIACAGPQDASQDEREARNTGTCADIASAQEALTSVVMAMEGVVGTATAECDGEPCIRVYLAVADDEVAGRIPRHFGGYAVATEVVGEMRPRADTVGRGELRR